MKMFTSSSNGGFDKAVQLFVTTNGKLQVTRSDTFYLQVLGSVSRQFEDLTKT